MKKILSACLLFLLVAPASFGQFSKGTGYVGATVSFSGNHSWADGSQGFDGLKSNTVSATPLLQFGKFVSENKMIGIGIGAALSMNKSSYDAPDIYKSSTWYNEFSLMPYFRHYKSLNSKWAIFIQPAASVSLIKSRQTNTSWGDEVRKDSGFGAGLKISPGVTYRVSPRFAVETDVNFLSFGVDYSKMSGLEDFTFNAGITTNPGAYLSVRAAWYLQKQ